MNAIVLQNQAIEPQTMTELRALAEAVSVARLGTNLSKEQALVLMMTGRDLGLSYAQSMRAFHVVNGKPVLSADAMVAVCLRSGKCLYFNTIETTSERCTVEAKRDNGQVQRLTFTMEDAKKAGLLGNPTWAKYPAQMLRARAKSALARDMFPDLLLGLYDPDEMDTHESTPQSPQVVEVEATEHEEDPEELFEIFACGLRNAKTVEALRTYWAQDIHPKRSVIKSKRYNALAALAKECSVKLEAPAETPETTEEKETE